MATIMASQKIGTTTKILVQVSRELKRQVEAAAGARETTTASFVRGALIEKLEREATIKKPAPSVGNGPMLSAEERKIIRSAIEDGDFDFSAVLDLPNGDEVMIRGECCGNHVDGSEFTGYVIGALETVSPLWALLSEQDKQQCTLSTIFVSPILREISDLDLTAALNDAASAVRVAEIETKIREAIRGLK